MSSVNRQEEMHLSPPSNSAEQLVAIQSAATLALEEADDLSEALSKILQAICKTLGWPFGAFWEMNAEKDAVVCKAFCPASSVKIQQLIDQTKNQVFPVGTGLPGLVLAKGDAVWINDVSKEKLLPRLAAFTEAGLHTAIGIPLRYRDSMLGICEFFSDQSLPEDQALIQLMSSIGIQIGQFIRRHQIEADLRQKQSELTDFIENASVPLHWVDKEGRIIWANQAELDMLGYSREEYIGQPVMKFHADEGVIKDILQRLSCNEILQNYEASLRAKDGSIKHVLINSSVFFKGGEFIHTRCFTRDVTQRLESIKRIEASEARVRAVIDTALDAVVITDERGMITEWNKQAEATFGWSYTEAIGQPMTDMIIPPAYREPHRLGMERYLTTGEKRILNKRIEITALNRQGQTFPIELTVTAQSYEGKCHFTAFVRDITKRKQIENELRLSEQRFRSVFNQQFQFMALLSPEGNVLEVNDLPLKMTGLTREQVVGRLFWETPWWKGLPNMQKSWPLRLASAAQGKEPIISEDQYLSANGEVRIADAAITAVKDRDGNVDFFIVQASDITDRKHAEEALHETKERLRLMVESIEDYAIFSLDTQGRVTTWNPGAEKTFGFPAAEIIGQSGAILFTPEDRENKVPQQEMLTAIEKGRAEDERWHIQRDGERFFASGIMASIREDDGHLLGFVKIARDVTRQKETEKALIDARDKADEANRAKSEFLANMSHEIRTPMNAVVGLANILLMGNHSPERQREFLTTLQLSAQSLMGLINDLLDIAKIESSGIELEHKPFNLAELIEEVISINAVQATEKRIELIIKYDTSLDRQFCGDPIRIRQILMNLVGNAVKFTERGTVTVQVGGSAPRDGAMELRIEVIDTGIGISQNKLSTIFSKFSQADTSITRKYGGTGLGLAISKTLVEMMGGAIDVISTEGLGSKFTVYLPLELTGQGDGKKPSGIDPGADSGAEAKPHRGIVLLVEDHRPNILVATAMLDQFGYRCHVAKSGREALEMIKDNTYNAILMDIQMQGMDGYHTTKLIREYERELGKAPMPIIAMTAHAFLTDRNKCIQAGMNDYISKPFAPEELQAKLNQFVQAPGI